MAKTAAERVLGTIAGGFIGLAVRATAEQVKTAYEFLLYGGAAGLVGVLAAWLSFKLPQGAYAAKLLVITFLLVFAGSDSVVRPGVWLEWPVFTDAIPVVQGCWFYLHATFMRSVCDMHGI